MNAAQPAAPGAITRVRGYATTPTGATATMIGVGTLVLPYLAVFHPVPSDGNLGLLAQQVKARRSLRLALTATVGGASRQEVRDAAGVVGGIKGDDGWVVAALLNGASTLPTRPLAAPGAAVTAGTLWNHLHGVRMSMGPADLTALRPRPQAVGGGGPTPASDWPAGQWPPPPPAADRPWWDTRPDWWPPALPYPLPKADSNVTTAFCFWCLFCCK